MDALLEVLPDMQACGRWIEQVCDDLLVDLQEAALAQEANIPAFLLFHHTHRPCCQQIAAGAPGAASPETLQHGVHTCTSQGRQQLIGKLLGSLYVCALISSPKVPTVAGSSLQDCSPAF